MWARRLRPALALLLLLSCELFLPLLQNLVAHAVLHGSSGLRQRCKLQAFNYYFNTHFNESPRNDC